jgi:hypothetical protein
VLVNGNPKLGYDLGTVNSLAVGARFVWMGLAGVVGVARRVARAESWALVCGGVTRFVPKQRAYCRREALSTNPFPAPQPSLPPAMWRSPVRLASPQLLAFTGASSAFHRVLLPVAAASACGRLPLALRPGCRLAHLPRSIPSA